MPLTPPFVRSHSSSRLPTPVLTMSTLPDSSASVCAPPPLRLAQVTFKFGHAELGGLLLDQLLLFHHVRGQVQDARLARDRDFGFLLRVRGRGSCEHTGECNADRKHDLQTIHAASVVVIPLDRWKIGSRIRCRSPGQRAAICLQLNGARVCPPRPTLVSATRRTRPPCRGPRACLLRPAESYVRSARRCLVRNMFARYRRRMLTSAAS